MPAKKPPKPPPPLPHQHSDRCYTRVLKCGKANHFHSNRCLNKKGQIACGAREHHHGNACWGGVLTCGK